MVTIPALLAAVVAAFAIAFCLGGLAGRRRDEDAPPCPYCGYALVPIRVVPVDALSDMPAGARWLCRRHPEGTRYFVPIEVASKPYPEAEL